MIGLATSSDHAARLLRQEFDGMILDFGQHRGQRQNKKDLATRHNTKRNRLRFVSALPIIMSFRTLSNCSTLLCGFCGIQLIATPDKLWATLARPEHLGPDLYYGGRRSACLFLGLGAIAYSFRDLPAHSEFRQGYCYSMASLFLAVAALGVWELVIHEMAPTAILGPVAIEVAFAAAFIYHSGSGRNIDQGRKQK